MSEKKKILLQLDSDSAVSSFDAIVAIDAGVERLLSYADIEPVCIQPIVYGAMFTRGGNDLSQTAIFLGGSQVEQVEANLRQVKKTFFGPVRVSVMVDPNGCNTTAVAAILSASRHLSLAGCRVVVFGGTGPVGARIAELAAREGATVTITSRVMERAESTAAQLNQKGVDAAKIKTAQCEDAGAGLKLVQNCEVVFASGAAGVSFLTPDWIEESPQLRVAVDCNAVPPAGLPGIEVHDKARFAGDAVVYGAVGIGGLKMKIHKRSIGKLFTRNDLVLDLLEIREIGKEVLSEP